jgi:hypothetical protein
MDANGCIRLLNERASALGRPPRKEDFGGEDVYAIKSALGPWPRALEKAGLKPVTSQRIQKLEARRRKRRGN